jgi:hypothetical protein
MKSFHTPKSDMMAFINWIQGENMPNWLDDENMLQTSTTTLKWLIRCEEWIVNQMTKEGLLDASQGSNSSTI